MTEKSEPKVYFEREDGDSSSYFESHAGYDFFEIESEHVELEVSSDSTEQE